MLVNILSSYLISAFTVILTEPMKYLFGRDRPPEDDVSNRVVPLRKDVTNPSFPSGDSAQVVIYFHHQ